MLDTFILRVLLQGLTLFWFGPLCEASSLGMTVHVVPQSSDGGKTVRAHFTVIAPKPCPALTGLCAEGEDCVTYPTSSPLTGTKPNSGWCVRQWQKNVPSNYNATVNLGSSVEFYVSLKAGPTIRANSGRLNNPPYVALPPPIRVSANCPHQIHLSAKDLDGDKVRCRFARADQGECLECPRHSFIELNEETCVLSFTGEASEGQYSIFLMAEDIIPVPQMRQTGQRLSAVPVHLSLTVEKKSFNCSHEPVATGQTPAEDTTMFVLPFQQADLTIQFISEQESVSEVAVVGPPEIYTSPVRSLGSVVIMSMAWVRTENNLTSLLPICFVVNTQSLQSESRCIWLFQRELRSLPDGTELTCDNTQMSLLLPVASLKIINLAELQLNSPTCPVTYNDTYVKAVIPLNSCGTKIVHSATEIIYTNTLQSVRPYTVINRQPSLILPLACRIPGVQVNGLNTEIRFPTEKVVFGEVRFWMEFDIPGQNSLSARARREVFSLSIPSINTSSVINTRTGSPRKIDKLDIRLMSNSTVKRAEMIVSECSESVTEDFSQSTPIVEGGCAASPISSLIEVITTPGNSKQYRINLDMFGLTNRKVYLKCTVNLCVAVLPSQKCPDLCSGFGLGRTNLVRSVFTKSYIVKSPALDIEAIRAGVNPFPTTTAVPGASTTTTAVNPANTVNPANPTNTVNPANPTNPANSAITSEAPTTSSHAPEKASVMAVGLMLGSISIFLQNIVLC